MRGNPGMMGLPGPKGNPVSNNRFVQFYSSLSDNKILKYFSQNKTLRLSWAVTDGAFCFD